MSPLPGPFDRLKEGDLTHPLDAFDPDRQRANAEGWGNSQNLERFAWDYEILGQLERIDPDRVTAFGGTATMLHLPLLTQRASVDADVFCGDADRFEAIIREIEAFFAVRLPESDYFRFSRWDPELQIPIPKRAYHVVLPSATGAQWRVSENDSYQPGTHIKIEVLNAEPPARVQLPATRVLPFASSGPHWVLPHSHVTAMKLLALATAEVGLPPHRITELVKHVYDVAQLSRHFDSRDKLGELIGATAAMLELENRWHRPKAEATNCATAVRTTVDLLEATVIREQAGQFADLYLRERPSVEEWSVWGKRVCHLAFVAVKRHNIDDYLSTVRGTDRLLRQRLAPEQERPLRKALVAKLRSLDLASARPSDAFPAVVFHEISFRVGYREAAAVVAPVLGDGWDA